MSLGNLSYYKKLIFINYVKKYLTIDYLIKQRVWIINILRYYLMPHPPLIIPSIGKGEEKKIQNTINACESIGKEIAF